MNWTARVALIGAFAAAPAALAPGLLLSFDVTPKIAIVLMAAGLCLASPDAYQAGLRAAWRDRPGKLFLASLGLRVLALAAATAGSTNPGVSLGGSRWRQLGLPEELALTVLAAAALGYVWGREERRGLLLDALAAVSIPISLYAVLQYFGVDPVLPRELYYAGREEWAVVRPPSTLGHAGYFATWAAPVVFLLWLRARESGGWRRRLALVSTVLLAVAIVLSGTRGALAGLVAGLLVARPGFRSVGGRRARAVAVVVVAAAAAFLVSPAGLRLRTRAVWSVEDFQGGARPWLWRDSLALGAERPLLGHGLETFTAEYARVRSEDLARRYPDQIEESPHNIFLDAWATQGLLGVAALAGLCWTALAGLRRAPLESAAFGAALAANQFLAFTAMTEAAFLLCGALTLAAGRPRPGEAPRAQSGWRAVAWLAGLLPATLALQVVAADFWAERSRGLLLAGRVPEAVDAWRRAEGVCPPGRSYGEWFARTLYGSEAFVPEWSETALGAFDPSRSESPADARYLEAALLVEAGRSAPDVERALRAAVEASPVWYKPRWKLAQILQATGRKEEALSWAESADRLAGGGNPEVRQTFEALRTR